MALKEKVKELLPTHGNAGEFNPKLMNRELKKLVENDDLVKSGNSYKFEDSFKHKIKREEKAKEKKVSYFLQQINAPKIIAALLTPSRPLAFAPCHCRIYLCNDNRGIANFNILQTITHL